MILLRCGDSRASSPHTTQLQSALKVRGSDDELIRTETWERELLLERVRLRNVIYIVQITAGVRASLYMASIPPGQRLRAVNT